MANPDVARRHKFQQPEQTVAVGFGATMVLPDLRSDMAGSRDGVLGSETPTLWMVEAPLRRSRFRWSYKASLPTLMERGLVRTDEEVTPRASRAEDRSQAGRVLLPKLSCGA